MAASDERSLYNRHRPRRFGDLVGQEHVTVALRNAVRDDRVGHAYLFSGPRGTGKTTTARILARALNCLAPQDDGEPCGTCANCEAITDRTFYDLVELDAASNRGVDAMRDLIQSVSTGLAGSSRRKVYVVDEVHMLTADASNTLLKTLEEPPGHVTFVLATTDPQKVLPTIRSRTQHFEFRLIESAPLRDHLVAVLGVEQVDADPEALDLVVRRAAGSARDALSLLDQALALGSGRVDPEQVRQAFGDTPFDRRLAVLRAVADEDVAGALVAVADSLAAGIDARDLADDLLRTLRDAFVLSASRDRVRPDDATEDQIETLRALAEALGAPTAVRGIETLGQAIVDLRGQSVPDPRLVLEVAVVRLARRESRAGVDDLADRLDRLEQRVAGLAPGSPSAAPATPAAPANPTAPSSRPAPPPHAAPPDPPAGAGDPAPTPGERRAPDGPGTALGAHRRARPPARRAESADAPPPGGEGSPPGGGGPPLGGEGPPPGGEGPPTGGGDSDPGGSAGPPGGSAGAVLDLDEVILAWDAALGSLAPPLRLAVQEAQPVAVEGDVVVFGVADAHMGRVRERLRHDADVVRAALAPHVGCSPKFKLVAHDGFTSAPPRPPSPTPAAPEAATDDGAAPEEEPEEEYVDLDELVDAPDAGPPVDSQARLVEAFGAEVVEERPRG